MSTRHRNQDRAHLATPLASLHPFRTRRPGYRPARPASRPPGSVILPAMSAASRATSRQYRMLQTILTACPGISTRPYCFCRPRSPMWPRRGRHRRARSWGLSARADAPRIGVVAAAAFSVGRRATWAAALDMRRAPFLPWRGQGTAASPPCCRRRFGRTPPFSAYKPRVARRRITAPRVLGRPPEFARPNRQGVRELVNRSLNSQADAYDDARRDRDPSPHAVASDGGMAMASFRRRAGRAPK